MIFQPGAGGFGGGLSVIAEGTIRMSDDSRQNIPINSDAKVWIFSPTSVAISSDVQTQSVCVIAGAGGTIKDEDGGSSVVFGAVNMGIIMGGTLRGTVRYMALG